MDKIYLGSLSIQFLGNYEIENFEIGKNVSSNDEFVKIVDENEVNSLNTLKSGEKFIIDKNIRKKINCNIG